MKDFSRTLSVLLAFNGLVAVASVSWSTESVTVKQGDSLNLTCTVPSFKFLDVIRVSFKNSEGNILTVADNEALKQPFSNIPRYKVKFNVLNHQGFITILYADIRGEDTGSLICQTLFDGDSFAETKVHVQVPVKEIYLRQRVLNGWKMLREMDVITLREMKDNEFECVAVVDGNLTPTEMGITIGSEDKTQFFTASEESKIIKNHSSELGQYYSEFKLLYSSMVPPREFNGVLLTCTAVQEGFSNVSTSALLRVEYTPVIMCDKYEHHSRLEGVVNIVCDIDANPMSNQITWTMDDAGKPGAAAQHTLVNDSVFHLSETILDNHRKQVQMTIARVEQRHFTQYHLSAENDISSAEVTIVLLPASLELSQIPSAQDQMMYFLRHQMPNSDMAESSSLSYVSTTWTKRLLLLLLTITLMMLTC